MEQELWKGFSGLCGPSLKSVTALGNLFIMQTSAFGAVVCSLISPVLLKAIASEAEVIKVKKERCAHKKENLKR